MNFKKTFLFGGKNLKIFSHIKKILKIRKNFTNGNTEFTACT